MSCTALPELLRALLGGEVLGLLPEPMGSLPMGCFKQNISMLLGYAIVAGSALVKVPQLIKIWRAQSVAGLSFASVIMENLASTSSFCYYITLGYPFSTWGENFFIFFQNIGCNAQTSPLPPNLPKPHPSHTICLAMPRHRPQAASLSGIATYCCTCSITSQGDTQSRLICALFGRSPAPLPPLFSGAPL